MPSLWCLLPDDLQERILKTASAMCIQRSWWRYSRVSHARRREWREVREHLAEDWKWLSLYPLVRREWRQEPGSWADVREDGTLDLIREETRVGMWGKATV